MKGTVVSGVGLEPTRALPMKQASLPLLHPESKPLHYCEGEKENIYDIGANQFNFTIDVCLSIMSPLLS